jgi:hypothetical protein
LSKLASRYEPWTRVAVIVTRIARVPGGTDADADSGSRFVTRSRCSAVTAPTATWPSCRPDASRNAASTHPHSCRTRYAKIVR